MAEPIILLTEQEIQAKLDQLAAQVLADYGNEEILLVGVLKGSLYVVADLSRRLGPNVKIDFVQVSSYGLEAKSSGIVQIRKDLDTSIEGRHVLVVEDIVDTGATLAHLRELLNTRRPASLKVLALLSKPDARLTEVPIEYVGFEIPNRFVVGYGLDYAERYRNQAFISVLSAEHLS